jgi:hypothetical protein
MVQSAPTATVSWRIAAAAAGLIPPHPAVPGCWAPAAAP